MERDISPPPQRRNKPDQGSSKTSNRLGTTISSIDGFRVFSWNINGITPFLQQSIKTFFVKEVNESPKASLRSFLSRHNYPEVFFLQEVKIPHSDAKTQASIIKAVNAFSREGDDQPKYKVFFTLPRDKHNARGFGGKVYGVCSIIREDFYEKYVSRVRDVDWDLEGRISVVELKSNVAIWNIYAVNGTDNPYKDSETGIVRGTRHDRKLEFHRLLLQECKTMEIAGWSHVIVGDLNVAPERIDGHPNLRTWPAQHVVNRADFNEKFLDEENDEGLKAVDVWRKIKGGEKRYTYHPRGRDWGSSCDRVDLTLVSMSFWSNGQVADVGILDTPQERGPSDHVPLWIALKHRDENSSSLGNDIPTKAAHTSCSPSPGSGKKRKRDEGSD